MNSIFNNYELSIDTLYKDFVSLKLNKEPIELFLKNRIRKIKQSDSFNYNSYVDNFIQVLSRYFTRDDLKNFYKNLSSLKIYGVRFQLGDFIKYKKFCGKYIDSDNEIIIDTSVDKDLSCIYHELFHAASSDRESSLNCCGFSYVKNNKVIGNSLNEGYTEVMTKRYFGDNYDIVYVEDYPYAILLEEIIGKEKMERLYLNADIRGLVRELEKYDSVDNIMHFINELDYLKKSEGLPVDHVRLEDIYYFLIECYVRKKLINCENLYDSKTSMDIYYFAHRLPTKVRVGKNNHTLNISFIVDEVINNIISENPSIAR